MIRSKDLHVALRESLTEGPAGGGAMLTTKQGAVLAVAGFEATEPKIVAALTAHVWAHLALVPTKYAAVGDLRQLILDVEGGRLALGELFDGAYFVCLYAKRDASASAAEPVADHVARLRDLQAKVADQFGDALSGDSAPPPADSPPASAATLGPDAAADAR